MEFLIGLVIGVVIGLIIGAIAGNLISQKVLKASATSSATEAKNILDKAKNDADNLINNAKLDAKELKSNYKTEVEEDLKDRISKINEQEDRSNQRESNLDRRSDSLDLREQNMNAFQEDLDQREAQISNEEERVNEQLERVSGMTKDQARDELLANLKDNLTHESAAIIRETESRTKQEANRKSREIISLAIQRLASEHTSEITVSTIQIPSDDVKGRIIGREGRNIRSFEQITGTNLIIDDSPDMVTVSSFDGVRREIAVVTLKKLLSDGRIQPARIEETYKKVKREIEQRVQEAGERAAFETGIHNLHPDLITALGRLAYRTSYGQSVLDHSIEVANIAGIMANELGLDPRNAKRAGLLHDIGKTVSQEVEGSHAVLGADMAHKAGEKEYIVHAIHAHHEDIEQTSILDILVQAADAVSAARPGARRESIESYIKRLEQLESIANEHKGVKNTYAIQAGRELRVMVEPSVVDEDAATVMAHDIAEQIEKEMQYPGQVKVIVIRETRSEGLAK